MRGRLGDLALGLAYSFVLPIAILALLAALGWPGRWRPPAAIVVWIPCLYVAHLHLGRRQRDRFRGWGNTHPDR